MKKQRRRPRKYSDATRSNARNVKEKEDAGGIDIIPENAYVHIA
jgi:hypothetical protein